jgi:hypothetical protein
MVAGIIAAADIVAAVVRPVAVACAVTHRSATSLNGAMSSAHTTNGVWRLAAATVAMAAVTAAAMAAVTVVGLAAVMVVGLAAVTVMGLAAVTAVDLAAVTAVDLAAVTAVGMAGMAAVTAVTILPLTRKWGRPQPRSRMEAATAAATAIEPFARPSPDCGQHAA